MRKSGHSAGGRGLSSEAKVSETGRSWRPNLRSHSGPERYVIVAISRKALISRHHIAFQVDVRRANFMPVCGGRPS